MQPDREGETVVTESQKVWRGVQESLRNEDFEKTIQLCNTSGLSCVTRNCFRLSIAAERREFMPYFGTANCVC